MSNLEAYIKKHGSPLELKAYELGKKDGMKSKNIKPKTRWKGIGGRNKPKNKLIPLILMRPNDKTK